VQISTELPAADCQTEDTADCENHDILLIRSRCTLSVHHNTQCTIPIS